MAFRLTAGYALAGLLLVFFATASLYFVLVTELEKSTDLFLADKVHVLRTMLRERPDDWDALREEVELESAARRYEQFYIRLLDERNTLLLMTPGMADQLDLAQLALQTQSHPGAHHSHEGKELAMSFASPARPPPVGSPATQTDTIQIAVDVSQKEELLARYRFWFWPFCWRRFAIFPLVGYQIARHGIRPVEEMATTARHISSTNLRERIRPEGYPFELASLASTFNQMLDRLEDSFERISRFSADIAHDLRTPVNNIRGEAEVALARARSADEYREVLESCLEEAVRLSDLIGDLLFLARAESPLTHLRRERVDVGELLSGVREYYEASAADGGVSLATACRRRTGHCRTGSHALAEGGGQPGLECLGTHAARRSSGVGGERGFFHDSHRSLRYRRGHSSGSAAQGVRSLLPRGLVAFPRFGRHRLGLAIVQSIVLLHGGNVEISSQPGQGTRVTLHMPASMPPDDKNVISRVILAFARPRPTTSHARQGCPCP